MHGGKNLAADPGAEGNGGRPPDAFTYRTLLKPEDQPTYDASPIGNLDHEIRLARANMAAFLREWGASTAPGLLRGVTATGTGEKRRVTATTYRPWVEVYFEHQHTIRRLESARAQIIAAGGGAPPDDNHDLDYEAWVSRFESSSRPPSSSDRSED